MMIKKAIKLKDIITIDTLKLFFIEFKWFFDKHFSKEHIKFIKHTLLKFIYCRDIKNNATFFKCPKCNSIHARPNTCKSKICPSCGKIYSEKIANNFLKRMINKKHRHILFTMPDYLRDLFIGNSQLLTIISNSLYSLFKKYFQKNNIKHFGFTVFFHTFGRDIKFNPHFHIIITEGGFTKNITWKNLDFFNWKYFDKPYKFILTKALNTLEQTNKVQDKINQLWLVNSSVYFNVKGKTLYNPKHAIKYLGRYLARAPIAEYKIDSISDTEITFWYIDLTDNEKKFKTMPIFHFIGRILIQIPPRYFKMVRHYGIYARNIMLELKQTISLNKAFKFIPKITTWAERIFKWLGVNPLICLNCLTKMKPFKIIHIGKTYNYRI